MSFEEGFKIIKEKNLQIAFAESITGGRLASEFVKNEGASKHFELGLVAYSNKMKAKYLDIPLKNIKKYGAVSQEIASAMAYNIKDLAEADIGVGITGNAGPTALEKSEVGEVYLALAIMDQVEVYHLQISGSRDAIIDKTVLETWKILSKRLKEL